MAKGSEYSDQPCLVCSNCGAESPMGTRVCPKCNCDLVVYGKVKLPRSDVSPTPNPFPRWAVPVGVVLAAVAIAVLLFLRGVISPQPKPPAPSVHLLMADPVPDTGEEADSADYPVFDSRFRRGDIRTLTILDTLTDAPDNSWDVTDSASGETGTVRAWVEEHGGYYDLFIGAAGGVMAPADCTGLFKGYVELKNITWNGVFFTGQTTSMRGMFEQCGRLTSLDLSTFDTSQVTDFSRMFFQCEQLNQLNVSGFDTSSVTNMFGMFSRCGAKALDVSGFNTSSVTNMAGMFYRCAAETLDVSGFDTSNVTNMGSMFQECAAETLDVSGFDTSNVTNMGSMFRECAAETLDVSGFDTSIVTNMVCMFQGCSVETLDVSRFDTSSVTNMAGMFYRCGVKVLDVSGFDTSSVTNMAGMFHQCAVETLDISGFDTSSVTNMESMFRECAAETLDVRGFCTEKVTSMAYMFSVSPVAELNLSGFKTADVENMQGMFANCGNLTVLDAGGFDFKKVENADSMFTNCGNLTSVKLGDNIVLGASMFANDGALREIRMTGTLKRAEANAFAGGCTAAVYYPVLDASWRGSAGNLYGGSVTWIKTIGDLEILGGTEGVHPEENYEYLWDDNANTKWCADLGASGAYMEWSVPEPFALTSCFILAANDSGTYPERNPRTWTLKGRVSEEDNWHNILDFHADENTLNASVWAHIHRTYRQNGERVPYADIPKYRYFRLEITESFGDPLVQLSEFRIVSNETEYEGME